MMRIILVFFVVFSFSLPFLNAQLANGSVAPDFSVTDINGNGWSLYSEMSGGKSACLDFSATWCAPCWDFHQSHVLNQVNANLGANTSVIFLEADFKTNTNCLYGPSGCVGGTQGNWVAGTTYPIADLSASNGPGVGSAYKISFVPTLYVISPDFRVWNIETRTYQEYYDWIIYSFALNATANTVNSSCGDNGSVILDVTGGFQSKTYKWSNGATTKDLVNIPGGTYTVTITDNLGYFKSFGPWTITGPQKRVAITSFAQTDIKCNGENTGVVTVGASFGTPGYSYSWSNGYSGNNNTGLTAGTYTVTVSDAAGCTVSKTFKIVEPPILSMNLTGIDEKCDNADGYISIIAQGGVSPYTYYLGALKSSNGAFSKLKGGTYKVDVVDANKCIVSEQIILNATHKPKLLISAPFGITCKADTIELNGQQSDNGSEFISEWTSRNGKIIGDRFNLSIQTSTSGSYQLKITNTINQCFSIDSAVIKVDKKFPDIHTGGAEDLNCTHPSATLLGTTSTLQTIHYWKKVGSNEKDTSSKIVISDGGVYVFHVMDTINLCVSKDSLSIKEDKEIPKIEIDLPSQLNCAIQKTDINASQSDQGEKITFTWVTNNGHIQSGENSLNPVVDKPGTYILRLVNDRNGCENSQAVAISIDTFIPVLSFPKIEDLTCLRQQIEVQAPVNNLPTYQYQWTTKNGHILGVDNDFSLTLDQPGTYELLLKSKQNYCESNSSFEIFEQTKLDPVFDFQRSDLELHFYDLSSGIIQRRNWDFGDGTTSNELNPTHKYLTEGTYEVCLELENECGLSKICKNITLANAAILSITSWEIHPVSCFGDQNGSIKINVEGGVKPYRFIWTNGGNTQEIINLGKGIYSVTVTDSTNSQINKSFQINEPLEINYANLEIQHSIQGSANGFIHLNVFGGVPNYQYKWSSGETTKDIDNLLPGSYTLNISDANNCKKSVGPFEVKSLVAVNNVSNKVQINLIPNPFHDEGIIEIQNPLEEELNLVLMDISGRAVYQEKTSSNRHLLKINGSQLCPGIYFVRVKSRSMNILEKWMVE